MKKKVLLFISLLLIMTNVKALTFNVDLTNIEDKTNSTSVGTITNIDVDNKEVDVLFQNEGEEVSFELTVTNTGNRAGTLKTITVTSTGNKIEYSNDLPENGLAINGNDTNKVLITARVKQGATTGRSSSQIKLNYNYEEGSCPEGETLSDDETECLCPTGYERNDQGRCVQPDKEITCAADEVYNSTKKICEKKEITPSPKTGDNILLILLLFILAGLALYAFLFKRFKTNKTRRTFGIVTAVVTLCASVLVLITFFGVEGILGAVINPILKNKEIVITVNEEIDLIEVWDGNCDLDVAELTPANIFEGGVGTESNPYKIKTAEQLSCFAKSINEGETYEGKFIKQIKNIKLNENLNEQATNGDLSNANVWISAGYNNDSQDIKTFKGQYDGDNKKISGLYVTSASAPSGYTYKGLFGHATNATFKNIILSDVFLDDRGPIGGLLGYGYESLNIDNVTTYGNGVLTGYDNAAIVHTFIGNNVGGITVTNTTNNINLMCDNQCSGIIDTIDNVPSSDTPNIVFRNVVNNGNITIKNSLYAVGGIIGKSTSGNAILDNVSNTGEFTSTIADNLYGGTGLGGIVGVFGNGTLTNSYNTGNFNDFEKVQNFGGLVGQAQNGPVVISNSYNSGNISQRHNMVEGLTEDEDDEIRSKGTYIGGIIGYNGGTIENCYNTGSITGASIYVGGISGSSGNIENCYNLGDISAAAYVGGIVATTGSSNVRNSYNKGNIIVFGGTPRAGGLVGGFGGNIYNSYNEGNILLTSKYDGMLSGGLCAECGVIQNSYNRGNITARYNANGLGGIVWKGTAKNCYNSGTITYEDADPSLGASSGQFLLTTIGGIYNYPGDSYDIYNNYNLGDIVVNKNAYEYPLWNNPNIFLTGIGADWSSTIYNSVNTGDITFTVNGRLNSRSTIYMSGIGFNNVNNSFNAGEITLDDSALATPIINDVSDGNDDYDPQNHSVYLGEISLKYNAGTGNKFNTNANNYAAGYYYPIAKGVKEEDEYNTAELARTSGTYTTESTPDILSIINGDNAFEIKQGETLPTLKVFNN